MSNDAEDDIGPGLRPALAAMPNFETLDSISLPAFRDALKGASIEPDEDGVTVDFVEAVGIDGHHARCILHRPKAIARPPVILNIHGGGYVLGDAAREAPAMRKLSTEVGCAVLSVDYRLAPETPYPGALDDCAAALHWLQFAGLDLGLDPRRLVIRGVSAGGGLAAGLMLRCVEGMNPPPRLLMLVYPMLDAQSPPPGRTGHQVWTRSANEFGWTSYLGTFRDFPPVEAVPGRAVNLSHFPPTFLAVGDIDLFLEENLQFAARLARSQVALEMHVYRGGYHGFNLVPDTLLADAFARDCASAIKRAFNSDGPAGTTGSQD